MRAVGHVNEVRRQGVTQFEEFSKNEKKMNCNSLYNRRFMSLARRTRYFQQRARRARIAKRGKKKKISQKYFFLLPSSRASRKMPRLPRLANKAPVMQARITMNCNTKTAKKTLFFTVLLEQFIGLC